MQVFPAQHQLTKNDQMSMLRLYRKSGMEDVSGRSNAPALLAEIRCVCIAARQLPWKGSFLNLEKDRVTEVVLPILIPVWMVPSPSGKQMSSERVEKISVEAGLSTAIPLSAGHPKRIPRKSEACIKVRKIIRQR